MNHPICESDLWDTAYRTHLDGIAVGLHDRCPFERCAAPPCVAWWRAARGQA